MSWLYLRVPVAGSSGEPYLDSKPLWLLKLTITAKRSYWGAKLTGSWTRFRFGMMFKPFRGNHGVESWISLLLAFRASHSQQRGNVKGKTTKEICGQIPSEYFAKLDPSGLCWRTSQDWLLLDILEPSFETWPRVGSMRNGVCFQLTESERHISEKGFGLWPTPTGIGAEAPNLGSNKVHGPTSLIQIAREMWLTPRANDPCEPPEKFAKRMGDRKLTTHGSLTSQVMYPTPIAGSTKAVHQRSAGRPPRTYFPKTEKEVNFATPQSRDYRTGEANRWDDQNRSRNLNDQVAKYPTPAKNPSRGLRSGEPNDKNRIRLEPPGGQLNPDWVEWLMGWPIGWTDLKPLEMDKFLRWRQGHF